MKTRPFIPLSFLLVLWLSALPALRAQVTAPVSPAPPIQSGGEIAATAAAEVWLSLVDDGQFDKAWDTGAKILQGVVTKEDWDQRAKERRPPLGKVVSRKGTETTSTTSLPGAPTGEYVVLQYNTEFEHKKVARETVTIALDGGAWKVSGYYIR